MSGKKELSKELQAYVEANRPLTYAEYCRVKFGRPGPGLPDRGTPEEWDLKQRYLDRMSSTLSELEVYFHESENEDRRQCGFGPLRPGDPNDVLLEDRRDRLLSVLDAILSLQNDRLISLTDTEAVLEAAGSVGGMAVARPRFDKMLPKLPTTSLEVARAMVRIGRAVLERRPDRHRELLKRYGEAVCRRMDAQRDDSPGR